MKTTTQNTPQLAFSFSSVIAENQGQPLLLSAMSHLADRLHHKIDMMATSHNFEKNVSLIMKQDDKELMVAALEADTGSLSSEQVSILTSVAEMARNADRKVFLSYDAVEQLFSAVSH
jgi:hypothetical protein